MTKAITGFVTMGKFDGWMSDKQDAPSPYPNESGISPTEYKVLISPTALAEKTAGGIIIPQETKERMQFAVMEGVLVAVSPLAFTYAEWNGAAPPKAGDRVIFAKYAGATVTGKDGKEYRVANDKDVFAVLS